MGQRRPFTVVAGSKDVGGKRLFLPATVAVNPSVQADLQMAACRILCSIAMCDAKCQETLGHYGEVALP